MWWQSLRYQLTRVEHSHRGYAAGYLGANGDCGRDNNPGADNVSIIVVLLQRPRAVRSYPGDAQLRGVRADGAEFLHDNAGREAAVRRTERDSGVYGDVPGRQGCRIWRPVDRSGGLRDLVGQSADEAR